MGLSLNNSCEADSLSCYYINSLNRTDAVHLLEYQVLKEKRERLKRNIHTLLSLQCLTDCHTKIQIT